MSLQNEVMNQIKEAMRNKDKVALESLRSIKSELLLLSTKSGDTEITENDELKLLNRLAKQRRESASVFTSENRADLAKVELDQLAIIAQFLPEQLSEEALEEKLKEIIAKVNAQSLKDLGKVMGIASKELAGKADGKLIASIVKQKLS